jgi:hypothetical protein
MEDDGHVDPEYNPGATVAEATVYGMGQLPSEMATPITQCEVLQCLEAFAHRSRMGAYRGDLPSTSAHFNTSRALMHARTFGRTAPNREVQAVLRDLAATGLGEPPSELPRWRGGRTSGAIEAVLLCNLGPTSEAEAEALVPSLERCESRPDAHRQLHRVLVDLRAAHGRYAPPPGVAGFYRRAL